MEHHGQSDGIDKDHVVPERQGEKRFTRRECVHGVEHLNDNQAGVLLGKEQFKY